jgi:hypothetical protein
LIQDIKHTYSNESFYALHQVQHSSAEIYHYDQFLSSTVNTKTLLSSPIQTIPDFIFGLLFIPLLFILYLSIYERKTLLSMLDVYVRIGSLKKGENIRITFPFYNVLFFVLYCLLLSGLIFSFKFPIDQWQYKLPEFALYTAAWILVKFIFMGMVSYLLPKTGSFKIGIYYYLNVFMTLGLFLVPVLWMIVYADLSFIYVDRRSTSSFFWVGLSALSIFYITGLIILSTYIKKNNIASSFHIILYLCTIEILPILLIGKYFVEHKII